MAPTRKRAKRRVHVVYLIRNLIDNKRYIGKTSGRNTAIAVETRWKGHLRCALNGTGWKLHRAMRKHGPHNFVMGQLYVCRTQRGALDLEKMEIARLAPEYNITKGGEGQKNKPYIRTKAAIVTIAREEARKAGLALFSTGVPCKQGHMAPRYTCMNGCVECRRLMHLESIGGAYKDRARPKSPEFRKAVSRTMMGKPKTPETRAKMAVAAKAREAARREKRDTEQCQMTL